MSPTPQFCKEIFYNSYTEIGEALRATRFAHNGELYPRTRVACTITAKLGRDDDFYSHFIP